jgi:hypothetical protein
VRILGLALMPLVACSDITLSERRDEPDALPEQDCLEGPDPEVLDFGEVDLGERVEDTLVLRNTCTVGVQLGAGDPDAPFRLEGIADVAPGSETRILLSYAPLQPGDHRARLGIETSDPAQRRLEVRLRGTGIGPRVEVSPGAIQLGETSLGCTTTRTITVQNTGNRTVGWDDLSLRTADRLQITVDGPDLPVVLGPGDPPIDVDVHFRPIRSGPLDGVLRLQLDDLEPVDVALGGMGLMAEQAREVFVPSRAAARDGLVLADPPVPETIDVEVDGDPVPTGWSYVDRLQAVRFEPAFAPDQLQVVIRYAIQEPCP